MAEFPHSDPEATESEDATQSQPTESSEELEMQQRELMQVWLEIIDAREAYRRSTFYDWDAMVSLSHRIRSYHALGECIGGNIQFQQDMARVDAETTRLWDILMQLKTEIKDLWMHYHSHKQRAEYYAAR